MAFFVVYSIRCSLDILWYKSMNNLRSLQHLAMSRHKVAQYDKIKSMNDHKGLWKKQSTAVIILDNRIKLPKLGPVHFSKSRNIDGRILNATIRRNPILCIDSSWNRSAAIGENGFIYWYCARKLILRFFMIIAKSTNISSHSKWKGNWNANNANGHNAN